MRITAVRQIAGDYGVLCPGQTHPSVADHIAKELIDNGLAVEATEIVPSETQDAQPSETPIPAISATLGGPAENKQRRGRS